MHETTVNIPLFMHISLPLLLILQDSVGKELGFPSSAEYRENIAPAFHSDELQGFFFRLVLKQGAGKYFKGRLFPLRKVSMLSVTTVTAAGLLFYNSFSSTIGT